jgi:hypothetical protein
MPPTHRAYLAYAAVALAAYATLHLGPPSGAPPGAAWPSDVALILGAIAIVGGLASVVVAAMMLVAGRAAALAGAASLVGLVHALRFLTPSYLGVAYGLAAWGPAVVAPAVLALVARVRPFAVGGVLAALALAAIAGVTGEATPVPRALDVAASLVRLALAALLAWCAARMDTS